MLFFNSSPNTYLLHLELLNFMLIAMSTQLLCGPSPEPNDVNPFLDAAMAQVSRYNCHETWGDELLYICKYQNCCCCTVIFAG